jgi:hypothetical protein
MEYFAPWIMGVERHPVRFKQKAWLMHGVEGESVTLKVPY